MALRQWYKRITQRKLTIMIVPDTGAGQTRDYVVSLKTVLLGKIAAVVAGVVLVAGIAAIGYSIYARAEIMGLKVVTNQMRRELRQVSDLRDELAEIWVINERLKTLLRGASEYRQEIAAHRPLPWGMPLASLTGPYYRRVERKDARDLGAMLETSPGALVLATAPGRVVDVQWSPLYGDMLIVDHGNGVQSKYAKDITTLVQVGDFVARGQTIGVVSEQRDTPVLFYQVTVDGHPADPLRSVVTVSEQENSAEPDSAATGGLSLSVSRSRPQDGERTSDIRGINTQRQR